MSSPVFLPGSTIGILGGGQLGRMLTIVAKRMGYRVVSWVGAPDTGPAGLADVVIEESFDSAAGLSQFLAEADVATVEFENIPKALLETITAQLPLHPGAEAITIGQHREREKNFLSENGIPCANYAVVDSSESLALALQHLPDNGGILKTAEFGYDGKGQLPVTANDDASLIWADFEAPRAVLEEKIDLAAELSVLVARGTNGKTITYDPAENIHRDHILDLSILPARLDKAILDEAEAIALRVADALNYVGILAVEFFVSGDGRLLVNEMAPRPHNSGHHTLDACVTSQFEQQLRTICGLPPGAPTLTRAVVMLNLLGDVWVDADGKPDWASILALPGTALHLYGKAEARRGRKMGHLNLTAENVDEALALQDKCRAILKIPARD
ncbi:MAG: 5-(carboxyamino)imidazole ribonucleotide synthase [Verrucomicrobiales bacterium]|nr:5-(carboxyamino)imidazole ribonucleotide synthase [Verrucomicrobiales bacterium]